MCGFVFFKNIWWELKIIVISWDNDMNLVLMILIDLDVYLFFVCGVILGDKDYVRSCKVIYDFIEFLKVGFFENGFRLC